MKIFLCLLWATLPLIHAQSSKELLRDGLFAEESEGDLKTAAEKYQTLLAAFEKERKVAAVALYRLAAVKRKEGDEKAALALYQDFATQFSDIEPQISLVRENYLALAGEPLAIDQTALSKEDQELARLKKLKETSPDLFPDFPEFPDYVAKGWLKPVSYLLELGVDPNKDEALRLAAAGGNLPMTTLLIEAGAAENHRLRDEALFHTLIEKRWTIAEVLREKGATLKKVKPDALLAFADEKLALEKIALIVEYGANPNYHNKLEGYTASTNYGYPVAMNSPLHSGVRNGKHSFVEKLLKVGAKVDLCRPVDKVQPLHYAAHTGDQQMITILLEAGADPNAICNVPQNIPTNGFPHGPFTPIDLAPVESFPLLLEAGAKPTPKSFLEAVASKNLALVQQMLSLGADPNSKPDHAPSSGAPLNIALKAKDAPMVTLLLKNGANFQDAKWTFLNSAQRIDFARRFIYPELHETKNLTLVFPEHEQPPLTHRQVIEVGPRTISNLLDARFPEKFAGAEEAIDLEKLTWTLFRKGKPNKLDFSQEPLPDFRDGDILEITGFAPNEFSAGTLFDRLRVHPSSEIPLKLLKATRFPFQLTIDGKSWGMQVCPDKLLYDLHTNQVPDVSIAELIELIERDTSDWKDRSNRSIILHRKGFPSLTLGRHDSSLEQLRLFPDAHLEFPPADPSLKSQIRSSSISASETSSPGGWRWPAGDQELLVSGNTGTHASNSPFMRIKRNPTLLQILADLNGSYPASVLEDSGLPKVVSTGTFSKIDLDEILIHRLSPEGEEVITIPLNEKITEWHDSGKKAAPFDLPLEAGDSITFTSRKEGLPGFSDRTHQYLQAALATSILFQSNQAEPSIKKLEYHQAQWQETPRGLFPIKPKTGLTSVRGDYLAQEDRSRLTLRIQSKSVQLGSGMTYWPKEGDFLVKTASQNRSKNSVPIPVPNTRRRVIPAQNTRNQ